MRQQTRVAVEALTMASAPLNGSSKDYDPLLEMIGDARVVLLGEASHGTSEYYRERARISRRLIEEKGFNFIAVEGDWPDCYQVNSYVKGRGDAEDARAVLTGFNRWPTWMWANWEIVELAEWLREHNQGLPEEQKAGFYGLDVYSLRDSMTAVVDYLDRTDPEAANKARAAYACFDPYGYGEDVEGYAWSTVYMTESCQAEVVRILGQLRASPADGLPDDPEARFNAEQNALIARNAENYYREMVKPGDQSWNVRDTHMMETLERLLERHGPNAKAIVWEHNTHIGDARFTDMARAGMVNVGQLARERLNDKGVVLVGFASHHGSVIAGRAWGAPMQRMQVPNAQNGSWEDILHEESPQDRLILLRDLADHPELQAMLGHRAIGVVYDPARERRGNYVPTVLPKRYDALIYLDETRALDPLHPVVDADEVPETYPWNV